MINMIRVTLFFIFLLPTLVNAMTGEQLLKHCTSGKANVVEPICYGYIHGSLDSSPNIKFCPKRSYHGYLNETVTLYLKTNPQVWKKSAAISVVKAVKRAYPCK
jgi:hypothetical protein